MAINTFTLTQRNYLTESATVILNSNNIVKSYAVGSDLLVIYDRGDEAVFDKLIIDGDITSLDVFNTAMGDAAATIAVYDNINDESAGTTNKVIGYDSIVYGVNQGSTKSILFIREGGKIRKIKANLTVEEVYALFEAEEEEAEGIGAMIIEDTFIIT